MTTRSILPAVAIAVLCGAVAWWMGARGDPGPLAPQPAQPDEVSVAREASAQPKKGATQPPERPQEGTPLPDWVCEEPGEIKSWEYVEDLPLEIAVFETVFWEPEDTASLRALIRDTATVKGKTILEIGTGSGLLSLCCLEAGAGRVVATDVNRSALCNAFCNAQLLGHGDRMEVRRVPLDDAGAFSVVAESERFDLIISNPPWEDATPEAIDKYALYDRDFGLLRSLLAGLKDHLKPGGRALLAYGCTDAIRTLRKLAGEYDVEVRVLDDRDPDALADVFLPGMLLEVTPRWSTSDIGGG